jgi:hypothetical protein
MPALRPAAQQDCDTVGVTFPGGSVKRSLAMASFRGEGVSPLRGEAILASPGQGAICPGPEEQGQDALATRDKAKMASPRRNHRQALWA